MFKYLPLIAASLLLAGTASADVRLPEVLGDHMVIQQNSEIALWGWAYAGQTVVVETSWGVKTQATADPRGVWRVRVRTPAAQPLSRGLHPEHITFTVPDSNVVQIKDILIGEVWLCAGQSNMEMRMRPGYPTGWCGWYGEEFWKEESKTPGRPGLRLFDMAESAAATPQADCSSALPHHVMQPADAQGLIPTARRGWQACTEDIRPDFYAVPYYFGAALQDKLDVPVGLVVPVVGGTPIECWMSLDSLRTVPAYTNANTTTLSPFASTPACLFNGMIAPLTLMTIRGVTWYQGEANVGMGSRYAPLFQTLIADWRKQFNSEDMPFYFVQIVPFRYWGGPLAAAELREAQASALQLKHTGMVVASDAGEPNNIHPKNKRDVGRRLAWQALNKTYGQKEVAADGPVLKCINVTNGTVHVAFENLGGGLVSRDGKPLTCFEVAGPDGKYAPASAEIVGDEVVVSSANNSVANAVRFGWGAADMPNLMSRNGLPARQFMVGNLVKIAEAPTKK